MGGGSDGPGPARGGAAPHRAAGERGRTGVLLEQWGVVVGTAFSMQSGVPVPDRQYIKRHH